MPRAWPRPPARPMRSLSGCGAAKGIGLPAIHSPVTVTVTRRFDVTGTPRSSRTATTASSAEVHDTTFEPPCTPLHPLEIKGDAFPNGSPFPLQTLLAPPHGCPRTPRARRRTHTASLTTAHDHGTGPASCLVARLRVGLGVPVHQLLLPQRLGPARCLRSQRQGPIPFQPFQLFQFANGGLDRRCSPRFAAPCVRADKLSRLKKNPTATRFVWR